MNASVSLIILNRFSQADFVRLHIKKLCSGVYAVIGNSADHVHSLDV